MLKTKVAPFLGPFQSQKDKENAQFTCDEAVRDARSNLEWSVTALGSEQTQTTTPTPNKVT
jgi:hypothetical protein